MPGICAWQRVFKDQDEYGDIAQVGREEEMEVPMGVLRFT